MANAVDDLAGELGSIASFLERVAATPSFEPGEMLEIADADPDLELTEQIGAGGVGVVYLARDRKLDREVAVKVQRVSGNEVADERLLAEARSLARLAHPNVVTVFEVRRVDGHLLVLMELVRGPTLRDWLGGGDRERDEILAAFAAAGAGLAAAHRAGVIHRDFKPDNVIARADGRVRVVDFGMAGAAGESERGGTPAYMAPEQTAGDAVDARADQYAFCLSLLEALTGAQPAPDRMAGLVDEVRPAGLRRVLARGLERDPADRWPDMDALLAALRPPRRWPIVAAAAAALLTGALVVGSRSCDAPLGLVIDRLVAERIAAIERFEEARGHRRPATRCAPSRRWPRPTGGSTAPPSTSPSAAPCTAPPPSSATSTSRSTGWSTASSCAATVAASRSRATGWCACSTPTATGCCSRRRASGRRSSTAAVTWRR
jgi:serine/threonine protein kinase